MKAEKRDSCRGCQYFRSYWVYVVCKRDRHESDDEDGLFSTCPLDDWPSVSRKDIIEILELTSDVEKDMVYGMDTNLGTEDELVEAVATKLRAAGIEVKEQKEETK